MKRNILNPAWLGILIFVLSAQAYAASVTLEWNPVTTNADGSAITDLSGYRLFRSATSLLGKTTQQAMADGSITKTSLPTTPTTVLVSGLTAGATYFFRLTAFDTSGNQSGFNVDASDNDVQVSTVIPALPPDFTAPSIPTNLSATAVSGSQINLSWTASTDNVGVAGYQVFRDGVFIATATATSFSNTGLAPLTAYTYRVAAFDAAGNISGMSAPATATTLSPSITISVDSTYPGYDPKVIDDGIINAAGGTATTWASDESSVNPHWIVVDFGIPTQITTAGIWWAYNSSQSKLMTSQQVDIQAWDGSAFNKVASLLRPGADVASSSVTFAAVTTTKLRFHQPANMGPPTYTSIIWLTEIDYGFSGDTGPDITPPVVSISSPTDGSIVGGAVVSVSANATDNVGVVGVQFKLDGSNLGAEDTAAPFGISWNTTSSSNGSHALAAVARDAAGNVSTHTITVTVDNIGPTVAFTKPLDGDTLSGVVGMTANASDNTGVVWVNYYFEKTSELTGLGGSATPPYSVNLDTTKFANGTYTLSVYAKDGAGNVNKQSITVNINNADTTLPSVRITSPLGGATLSGTVSILGTASDNALVSRVEVQIDGGAPMPASGTNSWSFSLDTRSLSNGSHTLLARAVDGSGNTSTHSISVTVNNVAADNTPPAVSIISPIDGANVKRNTNVQLTGSDNVAVKRVEVWVDGALAKAQDLSPALASFNLTLGLHFASQGLHSIQAKAIDTSGNVGNSAIVTVNARGNGHMVFLVKTNATGFVSSSDQNESGNSKALVLSHAQGMNQTLEFDPEVEEVSIVDLRGRSLIKKSKSSGPISIQLQQETDSRLLLESGLLIIQMLDAQGGHQFQTAVVVK